MFVVAGQVEDPAGQSTIFKANARAVIQLTRERRRQKQGEKAARMKMPRKKKRTPMFLNANIIQ